MRPIDVAIEGLIFSADPADDPLPAPTERQVDAAQQALGFKLPPDFVEFMARTGFYELPDMKTYWVGGESLLFREIVEANRLERQHPDSPLPPFFVAFADDGDSDQYCWDTRNGPDENGDYPVILFEHARATNKNVEQPNMVAESFVEWLKDEVRSAS